MVPALVQAASKWDLTWWIIYDAQVVQKTDFVPCDRLNTKQFFHRCPGSVAGKAQVNRALDEIFDGYVYVLDDDNQLHPSILTLELNRRSDGYVFQQELPRGGVRPICLETSKIDQAQFLLHRCIIGDIRYPLAYGEFVVCAFVTVLF
mmetsp:Transcript_9104/g.17048  ORF Transcript_9104/g.17048 Transcript_9104/m.17048 type:complete len:148 (+) Transcript_9104:350-793(+)